MAGRASKNPGDGLPAHPERDYFFFSSFLAAEAAAAGFSAFFSSFLGASAATGGGSGEGGGDQGGQELVHGVVLFRELEIAPLQPGGDASTAQPSVG
jgi:hypothetical protein